MSDDQHGYDASRIVVLEWPEAVRRRPGMYIGSVGERGLRHMVLESAEELMEEVLEGAATVVDISLLPDGGVRVRNDGAGAADLEAALTVPGEWPRPGRRVLGLGLAVVNALSSRLVAETWREGSRWAQEFERGVALGPAVRAGAAEGSGTAITFWPDREIFDTAELSFDALAERFRELAFLYRELDLSLSDASGRSERYRAPGGPAEFVAFLDSDDAEVISFGCEDERMAGAAECSFRWRDSGGERVRSFANGMATLGGGSHEVGLRAGLAAALTDFGRGRGLPVVVADQVGAGLTAVVSVQLDRPEFECCRRDRLGNAEVAAVVEREARSRLGSWLAGHPAEADALVRRLSGNAW
ncbi:DNA gyrase subunit B [Kitasatospora sp. NPDC002227]|uniref:DNA gyrase subunit B n=1 Tax=Kitasatospora sp. NPDC002227 TaxID=3154773 RepID=UPI003318D2DF